jgi:hypothetical protein
MSRQQARGALHCRLMSSLATAEALCVVGFSSYRSGVLTSEPPAESHIPVQST